MAVPEVPRGRQNFLGGFKLTLEHLARPPVTLQYPEEKRPKQPRQHGRHVLNRYEDGMEKCIGCELCAGVCPADCIYVRGLETPFEITGSGVALAVTVSIGIAEGDRATAAELLRDADVALSRAKSAGKHCAVTFSPSMQEAAEDHRSLSGAW